MPVNDEDAKAIQKLLTPSWLSGLIAVVIGLVLSMGVVIAFSANNSTVQQQLVAWQQQQPQDEAPEPGSYVADEDEDKPTLQTTWPLMIVWACIGLVVYVIAAAIVRFISKAADLKASLGYVNAQPNALLKAAVEHTALQVVAVLILGALFYVFLNKIVPYSITAAHASASDILSVTGILYLLLAFSVVVISLHIQAIFLRLALGRVRVFSA